VSAKTTKYLNANNNPPKQYRTFMADFSIAAESNAEHLLSLPSQATIKIVGITTGS
jgi:hypothetical protein